MSGDDPRLCRVCTEPRNGGTNLCSGCILRQDVAMSLSIRITR